jgi:7,8-dihydro-6-hydroxymethylpterin-pyrophosphokinase
VKEIEKNLQRHRVFTNSPRTIDVDILMWGDIVLESQLLTIPHPRFHERMFVLDPLFEISPTLVHPLLNLSVGEMRQVVQKKEPLEIQASSLRLF